jgi:uncharacterized protein YfaP (DUF2135 family)
MPITTAQIEVGTTRVLLHQTDADGCRIALHMSAGSGQHIHIGNATVTTETGLEIDAHQMIQFSMPPTSALYGIKDSGTADVSIMVTN